MTTPITNPNDVQTALEFLSSPEEEATSAPLIRPADDHVVLPVGLFDPIDGLQDTAQVRELNGFDEEILARSKSKSSALATILERAVTHIGNQRPTSSTLSLLTLGDRNELLLAIRTITWGPVTDPFPRRCPSCEETVEVVVSIPDIPRNVLEDKVNGRQFTVSLSGGREVIARWPSGALHWKIMSDQIRNGAELTTQTILDCIEDFDGHPLLSADDARRMSSKDRQAIFEAVFTDLPGPNLDATRVSCPDCGEEFDPDINLGQLFPF